jgi:hypothetical protein
MCQVHRFQLWEKGFQWLAYFNSRNEHLNTYDGAADVARALEFVRQRCQQAGVWVTHTCHTFGSVSLSGRSLPYALNLLACLSICEPQMTNQALLYAALTHYS